jgi:phage protein D
MLKTLITAALIACTASVFAQSDTGKAHRFDCAKTKDPKGCEERIAKVKAAHEKARKACDGKKGDEQRNCMRSEMCAQSKDPAKCEARVKEKTSDRAERRARVREACKDKKGEELRACIREHRTKK